MVCVTVVTVCYNAEKEIAATMRSVCQQDYPNIEYLIIDGASKDSTVRIAERIRDEYSTKPGLQIRIVSEPDHGIYDAMNKAIAAATGDWILFMNAGDSFYSADTVSKMFREHWDSSIKAVYGDSERFLGESKKIVKAGNLEEITQSIPLPFCHQAIFVRTEILKDMGFDTGYRQAADYDLFVRCHLQGYTFAYVDEVVCRYDMDGISARNNIFHLEEKMKIRQTHGLETYSFMKRTAMINRLKIRHFIKGMIPKPLLRKIRGY